MDRRDDSVEFVDYFCARLVGRFIDHGESLEDSAAFAEFWCNRIAEECGPGFRIELQDGAIDVEALGRISASHAIDVYLGYARRIERRSTVRALPHS